MRAKYRSARRCLALQVSAFSHDQAVAGSPLKKRLKKRLAANQVGQLSLSSWYRLATHVRLQITLTDFGQKPAEPIFEVALPSPE